MGTSGWVQTGKAHGVPVFTAGGDLIGYVGINASSTAAAKLARAPVEYSRRYGRWSWIVRSPAPSGTPRG